ncbi:CBS domain-containing protein [Alteromonas sp. CYL-A6]|uniref:CBS domain-containing protein n=1 Tax=Alteromonas nitratireducens TaxID=3390813 RepID=UPI0034C45CBF
MHALNLYQTESVDKLAWPVISRQITMRSPAVAIFTDFKQHMPHVIDEGVSATEIENIMMRAHVRMMLVVDHHGKFTGIISTSDIDEQKIMQRVARGAERDSLRVSDFMQPKTSLKSFDFDELTRATVGDIVETLKDNQQHHCLVLDRGEHEVRGVISVSDIARVLQLPLDIQKQPSFSSLSTVIAA